MTTPEYHDDVEKDDMVYIGDSISDASESDYLRQWSKRLLTWGVESRGQYRRIWSINAY